MTMSMREAAMLVAAGISPYMVLKVHSDYERFVARQREERQRQQQTERPR